jgi:2,3-diphosphopglycerate-independent phosphoglycerate mutase
MRKSIIRPALGRILIETYLMDSRVLFLIVDGLGEVGCPEFGGRTYLQAASLPTFDALADCGVSGLLDPVEQGLACGSDTAHMSIFGYDPLRNYQGRGSFESLGAGIEMTYDDIAFKCNFATMDPSTGVVTKRRVDRNFPDWGLPLCEALDGKPIPGYEQYIVSVVHATEHRCGVRVRGKGLSCHISDTDPLKDNLPLLRVEPTDQDPASLHTAQVINVLSDWIHDVLSQHPINIERERKGESPANIVLLRGCGAKLSSS